MARKPENFADYLQESINDYYQYNPDTLMPLLMLALAAQGRLFVQNDPAEGTVFASLDIDEVMGYDWVRLNPELKKELKEMKAEGAKSVSAVGDLPAELKDIYETFHQYDTVTVVQEYHHRRGILAQHSCNTASESAQRQYATLRLAGELADESQEYLQDQFLPLANNILVQSGIQPKRPRIRVALALKALLRYDGKGVVYNPFAGCALAGAMIGGGKNLYIDGDANDKLLAVARLLCYGAGQKDCHIERYDSTLWRENISPDYVLSTFLGYPRGVSAFDTCLSHCLKDFRFTGKFAGIAAPKDIFEKQSDEMKEALQRDWVDSIVLLPFGEVAVLIDASKPADRKNRVRFYNLTHPMLSRRPLNLVIGNDRYASVLKLSDVKKKGFLKSLIVPEIEQEVGHVLVSFGDLFEKLPRRTWSLARVRDLDRVLAWIDRKKPYNKCANISMQGIRKKEIASLFAPAYKLEDDCLIVNSRGNLEPRIYKARNGGAFFQDGFAFRIKPEVKGLDFAQLIEELCSQRVYRQLHPYGEDALLPESFTEEQVLALKLNRRQTDEERKIELDEMADAGKLPTGQLLHGENTEYTIHRYLGHGCFGYTYTTNANNLATGESKEVVLKEYFPWGSYYREGIKAVSNDIWGEDANRIKFKEEFKIMNRLGFTPDSHIVPALDHFHCDETDTEYYVMPFYKDGSLKDLQDSGFHFSEEMLIQHVVVPMCKALNLAHKNRVLHLDIKPDNILVDEYGDAILIDFGVAKQYDETDSIIFSYGSTSQSAFAAPELKTVDGMVKFGPQPDIYGLAATLYYLATNHYPNPILDFGTEDGLVRSVLGVRGFSEKFADAIVAGLEYLNRPKNAQEFLNLFPGCEGMKL